MNFFGILGHWMLAAPLHQGIRRTGNGICEWLRDRWDRGPDVVAAQDVHVVFDVFDVLWVLAACIHEIGLCRKLTASAR